MKLLLLTLLIALWGLAVSAQVPRSILPVEPGVSRDLAAWRAAHYSDIRYQLSLTLEKMSPVLKGTIEIRLKLEGEKGRIGDRETVSVPPAVAGGAVPPIILDWVKVADHEKDSSISNVTLNGKPLRIVSPREPIISQGEPDGICTVDDVHLYFRSGVKLGENVIKLDFTSPITSGSSTIARKIGGVVGLDMTTPTLASGSAVKRSVDKDGSEHIYSLFRLGNVSTAFPVFDQPDLKARFTLSYMNVNYSNKHSRVKVISNTECHGVWMDNFSNPKKDDPIFYKCDETKPISIYDFHFKAGPKK